MKLRWSLAALLCLSSVLNYMDRQTLSVLAHTIQGQLDLSDVQYSYVTASFLASYTIMYAVSGRIIDATGVRRGLQIFVSAWSAATMLHALANTTTQLMIGRLLLGAAEPANFPAGVKAVAEWFPIEERALAIGIFNGGTAIGAAAAAPVVSVVALAWGWRAAFLVTGALGFVWVAVWSRLNRSSPDTAGEQSSRKAPQVPVRVLLGMPATWACALARMLTDPVTYFLTFWVPKYLQQERGFSLADLGRYAWLPFLALAAGNVASGAVPRFLIGRGWSVNRARKTTMAVASSVMPVAFLLITRVGSPALALALIMVVMFGHAAWGNITLPAELFPSHVVGTVSGIGGTLGGAAGVLTQLTIGTIVHKFSFAPVFAACSLLYLAAFALVSWLGGELGVIRAIPRSCEST
jgi:MFS transporter, ACS family, hexuronate transporter